MEYHHIPLKATRILIEGLQPAKAHQPVGVLRLADAVITVIFLGHQPRVVGEVLILQGKTRRVERTVNLDRKRTKKMTHFDRLRICEQTMTNEKKCQP